MAESSIPPEKDPMAWRQMARDDLAGNEITDDMRHKAEEVRKKYGKDPGSFSRL